AKMNLEQLIDEVYGKYQAELKAKADAEKLQEQQETEEAIADFRHDFDVMISPDLQKELGIEICAIFQRPVYVCAKFVYMGENLTIAQWCAEDWRLEKNDRFLLGNKPDVFLNLLLIELGKIRAYAKLEPDSMTIEKAAGILNDCRITLIEQVYNHRHDLIHSSEEFEEDLNTAICLLRKLSDELSEVGEI
ncbi:MAG: cupin domain-containing protein, partial [Nostoc sp.]